MTSITAAVEAIHDGNEQAVTITLERDTTASIKVPAGKTVIFDLNGKTITMSGSGVTGIYNSGTLTVQDTSAGQTGKVVSTATTYAVCAYNSSESAKLTITGGTYTCSALNYAPLYAPYGTVVVTKGTDAEGHVTIPKFENNGTGPAVQCEKADLTIEAGEFTSASTGGRGVIYMTGQCTVNVTGGNFTCTAGGAAAYVSNQKASLTISGGTFVNQSSVSTLYVISGTAKVTGNASFTNKGTGEAASVRDNSSNGFLTLSAGTYSTNVKGYCASGYYVKEDGGLYVVTDDSSFAEASLTSGGTVSYYADIQLAMDSASDGDTITLLKDSARNTVVETPEDKTLTLNLNGKTLSGSGQYTILSYSAMRIIGEGTVRKIPMAGTRSTI